MVQGQEPFLISFFPLAHYQYLGQRLLVFSQILLLCLDFRFWSDWTFPVMCGDYTPQGPGLALHSIL